MEKDALTYGLRARASQLLTGLLGPGQQQRQQQIQHDRLTLDGANRGADDPDNRRQAAATTMPSTDNARAAPFMAGRSLGFDGPDDVHIPRDIGPTMGSAEAAR